MSLYLYIFITMSVSLNLIHQTAGNMDFIYHSTMFHAVVYTA